MPEGGKAIETGGPTNRRSYRQRKGLCLGLRADLLHLAAHLQNRLHPIADLKLLHDVRHIVLDGLFA